MLADRRVCLYRPHSVSLRLSPPFVLAVHTRVYANTRGPRFSFSLLDPRRFCRRLAPSRPSLSVCFHLAGPLAAPGLPLARQPSSFLRLDHLEALNLFAENIKRRQIL